MEGINSSGRRFVANKIHEVTDVIFIPIIRENALF